MLAQHDFVYNELVLTNAQYNPDYPKRLLSNEGDTLFYLFTDNFNFINSNTVCNLYVFSYDYSKGSTQEKDARRFTVSFQSLPFSIVSYKQDCNFFQVDGDGLFVLTGTFLLYLELENDTFKYSDAWKLPYNGIKFRLDKESQTVNVLKHARVKDTSIFIFKYSLANRKIIDKKEIALKGVSFSVYNKANIFLGEQYIAVGDFIKYAVYVMCADNLDILDTVSHKTDQFVINQQLVDSVENKFRDGLNQNAVLMGRDFYYSLPAIRKLTINSSNQLCVLFYHPENLFRLDIFTLDEEDITWGSLESYYGIRRYKGLNKDKPMNVPSFPLFWLANYRDLIVENNKIFDIHLLPKNGMRNRLQGKPIRYFLSGEYIESEKKFRYGLSVFKF